MRKFYLFAVLVFFAVAVYSQTTYGEKKMSARKSHTVDPKQLKPDFNAVIIHQEAPSPDGNSYRSFLMRQKIESKKRFPRVKGEPAFKDNNGAALPKVGLGLSKYYTIRNGNRIDFSGGIPNDNTLAISNEGILLSGINSVIWAYDIHKDTLLLGVRPLSLSALGFGSPTNRYFDPKLIYDEKADRFILVFLRDSEPATNAFMVAFSSSNDPNDPWYVYEIDGNPLNNDRWTDFPAISITDDELFITGNLIVPNVSWQIGFDGSVIWQIKKQDGYDNADSLSTKLFSDIRFGGKYIRNLHAVRGVSSTAPRQFFLSNRNFDVTNDTIFVLEVTGTLDNSTLDIKMGKTSPSYGVPPNGRQQDTDLSDPTKGLQTNDARVLGAITNGDWIQYVSTTVNPASGLAAIYHGIIENAGMESQKIQGKIISDPIRDYGYPNIAYTGKGDCDIEAIIGFNYTSPTDFPGVAAIYFDNDGKYSEVLTLKEGLNYTDKHSDSYERWGDYFGIQAKYNEPGKVWTSGFFGLQNNGSGTWINELTSPSDSIIDSTIFTVDAIEKGNSIFCNGIIQLDASNGAPPYEYSFNGQAFSGVNIFEGFCDGDTISYSVKDRWGCMISNTLITKKLTHSDNGTYPNPFSERFVAQFRLDDDQIVSAYIFDMKGNMIKEILSTPAKSGLNELQFDTSPLRNGQYVIQIIGSNDEEILVNKIFKME